MESMVKLTKKSLKAIMKDRTVTEETLSTFLTEVESIVNSRPLTASSDDINDLLPLTPNHFLIGRSSPSDQLVNVSENDVNSRTKWKAAQSLTNMFWNRWIKEYLPSLTCRKKWTKNVRNFQPGDLVIIVEKNVERSRWPLGRVLETFKSEDNIIRSVKVKTSTNELVRPAASLCLLEETNEFVEYDNK